MFLCLLLGGMGIAITIGFLDVFVLQADAVNAQGSASAGLELALGVPVLLIGTLLATGRPQRAHQPAEGGKSGKGEGWAQRVLREPRLGVAILIGAVIGTPGASYITALHLLVTGKSSTAAQAVAVVIFTIIEFALVIVPYAFLELKPESTKVQLKRAQGWLMSHARQLIAWAAVVAGAYMTITGVVRLS